jgi:hypothetical protein
MTATIDTSANAPVLNSCGIANNHAFSILSVFTLNDDNMFMMRNPWNYANFEGKWSQSDTRSWTDANIEQV